MDVGGNAPSTEPITEPPRASDARIPPPQNANLSSGAVRGVLWAATTTIAGRGVSILAQLVTAYVLAKSDFGVYAQVLVVSGLLSQSLSPAVDQFLVSRSREYDRFAAPAFWLAFTCGVVSLLLHCVAAPVVARLQGNTVLLTVLPLMGVGALFAVCSTAISARLSIQLRFRHLAALGLAGGIGIQVLTVCLALLGFGVYALVIPATVVNLCVLVYLLMRVRVPGLFRARLSLWPEILRSSTRLMGVRVLQTAIGQSSYLILGIFASDAIVGVYYFAFNLAEQVGRLLGLSVSSVLTPSLAQINDDQGRSRSAVLKASRLLSLGVTPFSVCQILFASAAVYAMFEDKWMAAVPLIQIMSIGTIVNVPAWPTSSLLTAAGRFSDLLRLWLIALPLFLGATISGAFIGAFLKGEMGAAFGVAVGSSLYILASTALGVRIALGREFPVSRMLFQPMKPLSACAIAAIPAITLMWYVHATGRVGTAAEAGLAAILFLVCYVGALRLVDAEGLDDARARLGFRRKSAMA